MPGTHLLPPNLLKLFLPRAPLPYIRSVGRDPDRVRAKNVSGVAELLRKMKDEKTEGLINAGQDEAKEGNVLEEGEEPAFTLAEETKRQMKREERRKKKEELFKTAKDTCECFTDDLFNWNCAEQNMNVK